MAAFDLLFAQQRAEVQDLGAALMRDANQHAAALQALQHCEARMFEARAWFLAAAQSAPRVQVVATVGP